MLKEFIGESVRQIIREQITAAGDTAVHLECPKDRKFGDWSISAAMKLAKDSRKNPLDIAEIIAGKLREKILRSAYAEHVGEVKTARPGFVNIFLSQKALYELIRLILREKERFGSSRLGAGQRVLIEFVSANPTGPLSIAHARQAAVGDTLSNILNFTGYKAEKEYYINDEGNQIRLLGLSLRSRYLEALGKPGAGIPENGYHGAYLRVMAGQLKEKYADAYAGELSAKTEAFFGEYAAGEILRQIREELNDFGTAFDYWSSQKELTASGKISRALEVLKEKGYIYEREGAVWFRSTEFGDDKDRVLVKSSGEYTYLTPDIAYHRQKFERGYERLINIWGPDHHGYVSRLKAAAAALGYPPEQVSIIIIQLAALFRAGRPVVMSTRAGEYVTLRELIAEVGRDAARFFFMMRRCDSHLDFDLELAKKQTPENPVYYVQYAHARIMSIMQFKKERFPEQERQNTDIDMARLQEAEIMNLARILFRFPDVIEDCALTLEPQGLTVYLRELAGEFHVFYNKVQVVCEDRETAFARLAVVDCVRRVLVTGLKLLGITPMERM